MVKEPKTDPRVLANLAFLMWLRDDNGYIDVQPLAHRPGYYAGICRMLFTHALIVGRIGDRIGFDQRFCYSTLTAARDALTAWQRDGGPEPHGWHRDPRTGRRRPDGDKSREYIQW